MDGCFSSLGRVADKRCVVFKMSLRDRRKDNSWLMLGPTVPGCIVGSLPGCSKELRPEGNAVIQPDSRNSNTFKVKTRGPELKEPRQQSRQCLSTSKTSAQLFLLPVPCGELLLIKQLLLRRSKRKNQRRQIFIGPGGGLLMATIDLAPFGEEGLTLSGIRSLGPLREKSGEFIS